MAESIIQAKCVDKAFDSRNATQYYPGDVVRVIYNEKDRQDYRDINLADVHQRKLVWLKTLGGRWVFDFDRANASNTQVRIFFCKECGRPFELLTELGTHTRSDHNKTKAITDSAKKQNDDEEEAELLARRLAEEAEETAAK